MKEINNTSELADFVDYFDLRDKYSRIFFRGLTSIETAENSFSDKEMDIRIEFDGYNNYGIVYIFDSEIDPMIFPEKFDAKWATFRFIENKYLWIEDVHKRNPTIGKYTVKIIPI